MEIEDFKEKLSDLFSDYNLEEFEYKELYDEIVVYVEKELMKEVEEDEEVSIETINDRVKTLERAFAIFKEITKNQTTGKVKEVFKRSNKYPEPQNKTRPVGAIPKKVKVKRKPTTKRYPELPRKKCPECKLVSGRYRKQTKDYRCKKCHHIFES